MEQRKLHKFAVWAPKGHASVLCALNLLAIIGLLMLGPVGVSIVAGEEARTTNKEQSSLLLFGFEKSNDAVRVWLRSTRDRLNVVSDMVTEGNSSLRWTTPMYKDGIEQYPAIELQAGQAFTQTDWRGFDYVTFDLINATPVATSISVWIGGAQGRAKGYRTNVTIPAWGYVAVDAPLVDVAAGKQVGVAGTAVALQDVRLVHLNLTRPLADTTLYIDNLRLVKGAPDHRQALASVTPNLVQHMQLAAPVAVAQQIWQVTSNQLQSVPAPLPVNLATMQLSLQTELKAMAALAESADVSLQQAHELLNKVYVTTQACRRFAMLAEAWAAAPQAPFGVGLADSMSYVYPRDLPSDVTFGATAHIALAQNEYENLQLAVLPLSGSLQGVTVKLIELQGSGAQNLQVKLTPVGYVQTKPQIYYKSDYTGWTPDPLLPYLQSVDIAASDVQSFWVEVYAPADTQPGSYNGTLQVTAEGLPPVNVPLTVEVWPFRLPDRPALPSAITHNEEALKQIYGSKYAQVREAYLDFLIAHKIMPDSIYRSMPLSVAEIQELEQKSALDMFNVLYINANSFDPKKPDTWAGQIKFYLKIVEASLAKYEAAGYLPHAYVYGFDETEAAYFPAIIQMLTQLKEKFPQLPVMTTMRDTNFGRTNGLDKLVDIWVPAVHTYDLARAEAARKNGAQVWWYIYVSVTHPYPNWFNDYPPIETRLLMGPMAFKFKTDGFLYYASNRWYEGKRIMSDGPFSTWDPATWKTVPGDGSLYYPGPDGPLASIRLQNYRDGVEDYNLLVTLRKRVEQAKQANNSAHSQLLASAESLLNVPDGVVASLTQYTYNPTVYREWRKRVAEAVIGLASFAEQ